MVLFAPFIGIAAVYAGLVTAAPKRRDAAMDAASMASMSSTSMGSAMSATAYGSPGGSYSGGTSGENGVMSSSVGSGAAWGGSSVTTSAMYPMATAGGEMKTSWAGMETANGGMTTTATGTGAATTLNAATSTPCSTSIAQNTYSTPAFGSGSSGSGWSGSPYNSCVQQCMASWGAPAMSSPPTTTAAAASTGSGMTHTVIVAPTQGILRYVPFVVNASVGDTIQFMWNANNHTVTKSSELAICNKTTDTPFSSGEQNKSFVFTQMVNTTNTTFYYCATPGHCPKGMFGIINPPNAAMGSNASLSGMMPAMVANSSSMASMWNYTKTMTQNNTVASTWGGNIDMSSMPQWAYQYVAENVMYSRTFLASNPETLNADGSVNLSTAGSTPLMVPGDITAVANTNGSSSGASMSGTGSPTNSNPSSSGSTPYPTMKNHAGKLDSSSVVAGFAVAVTIALVL